MKVIRGKVAMALVTAILLIPMTYLTAGALREKAMNRCTQTPFSVPDFGATVDLNWPTLSWVCTIRWLKNGEPTGETEEKSFPLWH